MTTLQLIVGCVAVYRGTVLVIDDRICEPLRDWVDYRAELAQRSGCQRRLRPRAWASIQWAITGGVEEPHGCPWCVSIWLGVAATIVAVCTSDELFTALCAPLVFSAAAGIMHQLVQSDDS